MGGNTRAAIRQLPPTLGQLRWLSAFGGRLRRSSFHTSHPVMNEPQLHPRAMAGREHRGRGWCFTLNNYTADEEERLQTAIPYEYLGYGREVGKEGTRHLQGYIHFKSQRTFKQVRLLLGPRFHIEKRRGSAGQAIAYCEKEGDFVEWGRRPMEAKQKGKMGGEAEKARWADIIRLAEAGETQQLKTKYPGEYVRCLPRLLSLHAPASKPLDGELLHEWWVGPTGTGKSRTAWELYPEHYSKTLNKWWDGYQFQPVVICEEWSPKNECTASALKIWADRYPFTAEVKGAMLPKIRPVKIIILSNYTIEQCFPAKEDCDPLLRRFKVVRFPEQKPWARMLANNWKEEQPTSTICDSILEEPSSEESSTETADNVEAVSETAFEPSPLGSWLSQDFSAELDKWDWRKL